MVFSNLTAGTETDDDLHGCFAILPQPATILRFHDFDMAYLPACEFTMGPDPTDATRSPAHQVEVDDFLMDRYPVTVAEFCDFLKQENHDDHFSSWMCIPEHCGIIRRGPGEYEVVDCRADYPVVYVTHEAALAYATWCGKLLPSEAQWERAARGIEGRVYPWGDEPIEPTYANYDFHYGGTTPVGSFPKGTTSEGVFDLIGNVKEHTTDWFKPYPTEEEMIYLGMREPFIYDTPRVCRVVRGGAWTKQASLHGRSLSRRPR